MTEATAAATSRPGEAGAVAREVVATRIDIPGRGTIVEYDGERYLPEQVMQEFARFMLWAVVICLAFAFALGYIVARWLA